MKVLMTSETYLPRHGGAEIHIKNLIHRLEVRGHNVTLLTNEEGRHKNDQYVYRLPWSKKNLIKIIKILWKESKKADLIHCHYSYRFAALSGIVGRLRGIPVFVTLHGMGILNHPGTPFVYQQAHSLYRFLSLKLSTHVISTSEDLAGFAYKYIHKGKVSVIANGFDEVIFRRDKAVSVDFLSKYKNKKIILTVRRLVPKNGIHYLIEAMPHILKKVPNAILILVGDGSMRHYIEKKIQNLNLSEHVTLLGEIQNNNVPQYIKAANVVVFPSTAESSSIACAEAMGMGTPVVASRVGGLIELLGGSNERGTLVRLVDWEQSNYDAPLSLEEDRYKDLAEAIVQNLNHRDDKKMERALNYAHENLSWSAIGDRTIALYRKFIK